MIEARPRMGSPSEAETGAILAGKVAVVTGGASDIGGAIAKAFANQGCRLVLAGRRRVPLEEVAHEVEGLAVPCDVSVEADVVGLMRACDEAYGRLEENDELKRENKVLNAENNRLMNVISLHGEAERKEAKQRRVEEIEERKSD